MHEPSDRPKHTAGDHIYDALYIAGVGGGIVALFFLVYDVLTRGDAFFTPSLMGSVLFEGLRADTVQGVSMPAVARFTVVHLVAFGLLGLVLSWITHQAEMRSRHPVLVIGLVFVALEVAFWTGASVAIPGVLQRIGVLPVAVANLLASVGIGTFLAATHRPGAWFRSRREAAQGGGPPVAP
jgi:hypothetical protein